MKKIIIPIVAIIGLIISIFTAPAEIKTIAFFIAIEIIILAFANTLIYIVRKLELQVEHINKSFSNFLLGIHLCAGMIVMGVYFTL